MFNANKWLGFVFLFSSIFVSWVALAASPTRPDKSEPASRRGPGVNSPLTPAGKGIVWDQGNGVYWLADANLAASNSFGIGGINPDGTMKFATALKWIKALNASNYLDHHDWQLPVTPTMDATCAVPIGRDGNSFGPNCTVSALGNLYGVGLHSAYPEGVVPQFTDLVAPFKNLQPSLYWTSDNSTNAAGR